LSVPGAAAPRRPTRLPRERLLPAAIFAGAILLLFAPAVFGDGQFLYRDAGRLHAPVKRWIASELAAGRFPSWNPYEAMGTSLVTDPIHAVQHPFNVLLLLLPFDAALKGWILACYLVAALGAFAWVRRLGAGRDGAMVAGLAYGLSGFLVSSSDNLTYLTTAAFVPWVLAAGHAFVTGGRWGRLAGLMIASWLCAASGDPLAWAIAVALVPVLAVLLEPGARRRALLRALAGAIGAVLAAAPIVLPLARGLADSARGDGVDELARRLWNLHPLRLLELAVPNLTSDPAMDTSNEVLRVFVGAPGSYGPWVLSVYVGVTVLVLAAVAAKLRDARVLLGIAALFTWAAMGPHSGFGQLAQRLPVLSSLRYWEKLAVWPTLFVAGAAGLGAGALVAGSERARRAVSIAAGAAAVGAIGLAITRLAPLERWLRITPDAGAAASALAANLGQGALHVAALAGTLAALIHVLAKRGRGDAMAPLLLLVVAADLVAANVSAYRLAAPPDRVAPSALRARLRSEPGLAGLITPFYLAPDPTDGLSPFESKWRQGAQTLLPAWNMVDRVRNASPYSALYSRRYARYEADVPLETRVASLGLFGFGFVAVPGAPALLERTVLRPPWEIAARDEKLGVLVAIPHRPRAYLAPSARTASPEEAMTFAADPASIAAPLTLVEGPIPAALSGGRAEIVEAVPARVRVRTDSKGPALLVLNDAFAPGWTATVDGRPSPILATNYLARGVQVPGGPHEVLFRYRAPLLAAGWAIAVGALLLVIASALVSRRRGGSGTDMQTLPSCKD
jgi:hypothetical protein